MLAQCPAGDKGRVGLTVGEAGSFGRGRVEDIVPKTRKVVAMTNDADSYTGVRRVSSSQSISIDVDRSLLLTVDTPRLGVLGNLLEGVSVHGWMASVSARTLIQSLLDRSAWYPFLIVTLVLAEIELYVTLVPGIVPDLSPTT